MELLETNGISCGEKGSPRHGTIKTLIKSLFQAIHMYAHLYPVCMPSRAASSAGCPCACADHMLGRLGIAVGIDCVLACAQLQQHTFDFLSERHIQFRRRYRRLFTTADIDGSLQSKPVSGCRICRKNSTRRAAG